jgi:hypothetical protein
MVHNIYFFHYYDSGELPPIPWGEPKGMSIQNL